MKKLFIIMAIIVLSCFLPLHDNTPPRCEDKPYYISKTDDEQYKELKKELDAFLKELKELEGELESRFKKEIIPELKKEIEKLRKELEKLREKIKKKDSPVKIKI